MIMGRLRKSTIDNPRNSVMPSSMDAPQRRKRAPRKRVLVKRYSFRATPAEMEALKKAAKLDGRPTANAVRFALRAYIVQVFEVSGLPPPPMSNGDGNEDTNGDGNQP